MRKPILVIKTSFVYFIFAVHVHYSGFNLWLDNFLLFRTQIYRPHFLLTGFFPTGILVTATKDKDNHYSYNTVTVVLLTEFVKLLVAVGLQLRTYVNTFQRFVPSSVILPAGINQDSQFVCIP